MAYVDEGFKNAIEENIRDVLEEYKVTRPRLYRANREFFEEVERNIDKIAEIAQKLREKRPRRPRSFILCTPNKLSKWTSMCIYIDTSTGDVEIRKLYKPWQIWKSPWHLTEEMPEEISKDLEKLLEELEY